MKQRSEPSIALLATFSAMLAGDHEAVLLHARDLQIIALFCSFDRAVSIGAAATSLGLSSSYMSRIVDRLVARRFLMRTTDRTDRRVELVKPTADGRRLDARVKRHFESASAEVGKPPEVGIC
jgi:DNA-binding MarR family transcriptional regulator